MSRPWSDPSLAPVAALIAARMGLSFSDIRRPAVEQALHRARAHAGVADWATYCSLLDTDRKTFDALATSLTVDESYFFRDRAQFDFLRETCVSGLASQPGPILAWSAGCAAGQEPYSLAILCEQAGIADRARIVGTDLSRARLGAAVRGRYQRWSLRGVSEDVLQRYFRPVDARVELAADIRRMVTFRQMNLADESDWAGAPRGVDILLCRNVLIYFAPDAIARVARHLIDALSDRGWLLLGASDPALADFVDCEVHVTPAGLAYRRPRGAADRPRNPATSTRGAAQRPPSPHVRTPAPSAQARPDPISVDTVRALADRGELAAAMAACRAAVKECPESVDLLYLQCVLLAQSGRHAEAIAAARRALYLDRSFALGHAALGLSLAEVGDRIGAVRSLKTALELLAAIPQDAPPSLRGAGTIPRVQAAVAARLRLLEAS